MNRYAIYCTEEQTRKALELGAPIAKTQANPEQWFVDRYPKRIWVSTDDINIDVGYVLALPAAEQLIGWLEEQGLLVSILYGYEEYNKWAYDIDSEEYIGYKSGVYNSRKAATLAAIDAALEYLTNKK